MRYPTEGASIPRVQYTISIIIRIQTPVHSRFLFPEGSRLQTGHCILKRSIRQCIQMGGQLFQSHFKRQAIQPVIRWIAQQPYD